MAVIFCTNPLASYLTLIDVEGGHFLSLFLLVFLSIFMNHADGVDNMMMNSERYKLLHLNRSTLMKSATLKKHKV